MKDSPESNSTIKNTLPLPFSTLVTTEQPSLVVSVIDVKKIEDRIDSLENSIEEIKNSDIKIKENILEYHKHLFSLNTLYRKFMLYACIFLLTSMLIFIYQANIDWIKFAIINLGIPATCLGAFIGIIYQVYSLPNTLKDIISKNDSNVSEIKSLNEKINSIENKIKNISNNNPQSSSMKKSTKK